MAPSQLTVQSPASGFFLILHVPTARWWQVLGLISPHSHLSFSGPHFALSLPRQPAPPHVSARPLPSRARVTRCPGSRRRLPLWLALSPALGGCLASLRVWAPAHSEPLPPRVQPPSTGAVLRGGPCHHLCSLRTGQRHLLPGRPSSLSAGDVGEAMALPPGLHDHGGSGRVKYFTLFRTQCAGCPEGGSGPAEGGDI